MAQTYHPDKQQDEVRKAAAATSFMRIQEAYEVSAHPQAMSLVHWSASILHRSCSQQCVVPHR